MIGFRKSRRDYTEIEKVAADSKSTEGLKQRLEHACRDLWWSSESDYPVEVVWQSDMRSDAESDVESDSDALPHPSQGKIAQTIDSWVSKQHPEGEIEKVDVGDFFERATTPRSWHTEEDKDQLNRLRRLRDLLTDELSDLQAYRCGEVEISAYVLGRSAEVAIAGVRTTIVKT